MLKSSIVCLTLAGTLTCLVGTAARSDAAFEQEFQSLLSKANISGAETLARSRLVESPGDAQAQFALGIAQFLDAVEGLGQGLYRHGLTNVYDTALFDDWLPDMSDLPFLRLPMPANPAPEPFSAVVFRQILTDFDARLLEADATLAQVPAGPVYLPLYVKKILLDFNGDGIAQSGESIPVILNAISDSDSERTIPLIQFDESDVPWLRGYTHLLAGISDMLLAHDWTDVIDAAFQSAFPESPLASAPLEDFRKATMEDYKRSLDAKECDYPESDKDPENDETLTAEEQLMWNRYLDCERTRLSVEFGGIADFVAFVHLFHWPVVDPARLLSAREHFLTMISLSRQSWGLIKAESDDNSEWVPGPEQSSLFPNLRVTEEIVAGWTDFLDQAEGVLEGRLLIAHWRFDKSHGLNVRRMFEEPRTLDPILIISGSGALPYLETGPLAPGATMDTGLSLLSGGGLMAYFFWFN